ncbi:methyl-accepting chemotaxis protein [Leisingera caerulea]|uniref:methyl-accepting chemotaxis protein n=1 Tax=Leisingera caerulea TaxID=506591 RepID=UPI0003FBABE6|nr:methyl-accepting chemotaxis protein [Leisingera caerulea]
MGLKAAELLIQWDMNMTPPFQTISGKLLAAITLAVTILVICYTTLTAWRVSSETHEQTLEQATLAASGIALTLAAELTEATAAAASVGGALTGFLEEGEVPAGKLINLLKGVPERFGPGFFAWMAAIPGGATDTLIVGDEGRNAKGVFTPYWTKTETGDLTFESFEFEPDTTVEWYRKPQVTGEGLITEPYLSNEGRLLTSVSVPVFVGDEIAAVAGVDVVLDNLTALVTSLSVFDGGQVMLLGQGGKWLAHADKEKITRSYEGPGAEALAAAVETGEVQVAANLPDGATRLFYPFTAFGMNKTWVVVMDVPHHVFAAPVRQSIIEKLVASGLLLLLTLVTIFFSAQSLVRRPLAKMLTAVNSLSEGRVQDAVDLPKSRDEIGNMAGSIEKLRQGLAEKESLEMARLKEQEDQKRVVHSLASGLQSLASGDLTSKLDQVFPDHYEQLRKDFNDTVDTLNGTVSQVVASTESIRTGAAEISQSSDDLSHRTESQAATLEETAAALDELTASVRSTAEGARSVENITGEAKQEAEASGQVVQSAVAAMTEIEESSKHISQIIGLIDDIAFQTNLLALNAGVEAARAGEAGKGFAVVASEVRALAQRSSDAAMEIKTLISESSKQVERGVDLVGKAGEALTSIVERVSQIARLVSDIAEGASEQSTGLGEINTGVVQLDQVTQQNAAMVEQATAASHLLNSDAGKLGQIVDKFKVSAACVGKQNFGGEAPLKPTAHGSDNRGMGKLTTAPVPVATTMGSAARDVWKDF